MNQLIRFGIILFLLSSNLNFAWAEEVNNWPKKIEKNGASIIIYQPQLESFTENKLESRAAVSVTNQDNPTPVFAA